MILFAAVAGARALLLAWRCLDVNSSKTAVHPVSIDPPEASVAIEQVREAQQRFQRVLANWASDMFQLRAAAWRHPQWTPVNGTGPNEGTWQEAA